MKGNRWLYVFLSLSLLIAGLLIRYFSQTSISNESLAAEVARKLERELRRLDEDLADVVADGGRVDFEDLSYPVFEFNGRRLVSWSDNSFVPAYQDVAERFEIKAINTGSESYVLRKIELSPEKFVVGVIKLFRSYPVTNDFLPREFNDRILPSADIIVVDPQAPRGLPVCIRKKCLFRVQAASPESGMQRSAALASVIFVFAAVITLLAFLFQVIRRTSGRFAEMGFLLMLGAFALLRIIFTATSFPASFIESPLFDPQVFAVSAFNASLGDLFLNLFAVLILCLYIFRNYYRFRLQWLKRAERWSWIIGIFAGLCILFAGLFPYIVIQTLYNNSSIVLDISQSLRFDSLRILAILSVLISAICSFLFAHAFIRTLSRTGSTARIFTCLGIASIVFVVINETTQQQYLSVLVVTIAYFTIVYFFGLARRLMTLNFGTFAYLFAAIFCLSVISAVAIQYFTRKEKIENQFRFATNFLIDRDYFGEFLLDEASGKIARDAFIQSRILSPFLSKEAVRQKIRQVFLPGYFNKYDISIHIFNSAGEPVDDSSAPLAAFLAEFDQDAYRTQYEGIRFIDNPGSDAAQKYLVIIPVLRTGATIAHIVIQLTLKKIIPESVYPELLVDYSYQQFYRTGDLSYAVYADRNLLFTSGEFNYERFFDRRYFGDPLLHTKGLRFSGFIHIAVEDQSGRIAIVSTRETPFMHKLSNFSFLLTLGLLVILVLIFIQGLYQYFRGRRLFFSARIQLYLNLAFFIPLTIVSVSTLSLTSRSSQQQLNEEYLSKSRTFGQQMTNYLEDEQRVAQNISLENRLNDLAALSNLDANIYDPSGALIATSQPLIFERNLLSTYVNARAMARIRNGENLFVESEKVGKLDYYVSYSVLKSPRTGRTVGILGIPFFQSAHLLERIQSVILINILNIFALIFIILLLLSYIVAERLTFPLRFITESLRKTSLTGVNRPLTWPAEDEIGYMVREYNAMLYKLGESKRELEQTQREKAWREIAQQVAHEIKNPLTPMKLTLQQLERSLQQGNNSVEKTQKAIQTLLGQVDSLNDIASSFSGFVKMPQPVMERVDVLPILRHTVDLHSPTGEIQFRPSVREAWVSGDAQMLNRTFSNILLNAIQSARPGQQIAVQVSIEALNGKCRVTFRDNGKGIDPLIADRVFLPHFSTKQTGSGLGLAIAKQAIEQMNGRVWFDTSPAGTAFYVELPLL